LYDVRINFGAPVAGETGRLFLPFDAAIGKKLADGIVKFDGRPYRSFKYSEVLYDGQIFA
jgi:hypothetical protein